MNDIKGEARQENSSLGSAVCTAVAIALLVARWLVPTEAASQGTTLWLVSGWLVLALFWCFLVGAGLIAGRLHPDRYDGAACLLLGPQVLSAIVMVAGHDGDGRAAMNHAWEWIGLGIQFFLLRRLVWSLPSRQALLRVAVSTAIVTAGLGVWQHHVGYRQSIADYTALRERLDQARQTNDSHALRKVQAELSAMQIPQEGPALALWEQRLRDSREPFGLFALANSLAGLQVSLILIGVVLVPAARDSGWTRARQVALVAALLLLAYCIVLTKSRTAWVGLACGSVWLVLRTRSRLFNRRQLLLGTGALAGTITLLTLAAWATRGFDLEVITEAPKSLAYRFEYWRGTLGVIEDRPWLGTGPGNFRQHYLRHKLEGSSEEIADPHNLFFEATATAGLPGILGLCGFFGLVLWPRRRSTDEDRPQQDSPPGRGIDIRSIVVGGAAGFLVVWFHDAFWFIGQQRVLFLLVGWAVAMWVLPSRTVSPRHHQAAVTAAGLALLVHLLGAGGFSFPALAQLGLLLVACRHPLSGASCPVWQRKKMALVLPPLALLILCYTTAILPLLKRTYHVQLAGMTTADGGGQRKTIRHLQDAADVDPLAPGPLYQLSGLELLIWKQQAQLRPQEMEKDQSWKRAIGAAKAVIERDPHSWAGYEALASCYRERFDLLELAEDAHEAITWLKRAITHYPSNVQLRARLAILLDRTADDEARTVARTALRLEQINQDRGHNDKLLPPRTLEQVKQLAEGPDRN